MKETIYNLFAIVEDGHIRRVGITPHTVSIPDDEKDEYLKSHAEEDLAHASYYPVPNYIRSYNMDTDEESHGINEMGYKMFAKNGEVIGLFEEGFKALDAPMQPFVFYSVVKDNRIVEMHP